VFRYTTHDVQVTCILLSKGLYFVHDDLVRFSQKRQYASFRNTILSVLCRDSLCLFAESYEILHVSEENAGRCILILNIAALIIIIKISRVNTAL